MTNKPTDYSELDELRTAASNYIYEHCEYHGQEDVGFKEWRKNALDELVSLIQRLVLEGRLDELIWSTGGVLEFTDEGKKVIPDRIAQLNKQLGGSDERTKI